MGGYNTGVFGVSVDAVKHYLLNFWGHNAFLQLLLLLVQKLKNV